MLDARSSGISTTLGVVVPVPSAATSTPARKKQKCSTVQTLAYRRHHHKYQQHHRHQSCLRGPAVCYVCLPACLAGHYRSVYLFEYLSIIYLSVYVSVTDFPKRIMHACMHACMHY